MIKSSVVCVDELVTKFYDRHEMPRIQREYVWENVQVEELLNDVYDAWSQSKHNYFLGCMLFKVEEEKFLIFDGQQRLTTIAIIMEYIAHNPTVFSGPISTMVSVNLLKIKKENERTRTFDWTPKKNDAEEVYDKFETITNARNSVAYFIEEKFFQGEVGNETLDIGEFSLFMDFFTNKVNILLIESSNEEDSEQIFVAMNDKGKKFSSSDKIKAFLLNKLQSIRTQDLSKAEKVTLLSKRIETILLKISQNKKNENGTVEIGSQKKLDIAIQSIVNVMSGKRTASAYSQELQRIIMVTPQDKQFKKIEEIAAYLEIFYELVDSSIEKKISFSNFKTSNFIPPLYIHLRKIGFPRTHHIFDELRYFGVMADIAFSNKPNEYWTLMIQMINSFSVKKMESLILFSPLQQNFTNRFDSLSYRRDKTLIVNLFIELIKQRAGRISHGTRISMENPSLDHIEPQVKASKDSNSLGNLVLCDLNSNKHLQDTSAKEKILSAYKGRIPSFDHTRIKEIYNRTKQWDSDEVELNKKEILRSIERKFE